MSSPPPLQMEPQSQEPAPSPPNLPQQALSAQEMLEFSTLFPGLNYWTPDDIARQLERETLAATQQTQQHQSPSKRPRSDSPNPMESPTKKMAGRQREKQIEETTPVHDQASIYVVVEEDRMEVDQDETTTQNPTNHTIIVISSDTEDPQPDPSLPSKTSIKADADEKVYAWLEAKLFGRKPTPLSDLQEHIIQRRSHYRTFTNAEFLATERGQTLLRLQQQHEEYKETQSIIQFGIRRLATLKINRAIMNEGYDLDEAMEFAATTTKETEACIANLLRVFPTDPIYISNYLDIRKNTVPASGPEADLAE